MHISKFHYYVLWLAIIILAILQLIRVAPLITWGTDTFIGVSVALMGITMAIIIGYQAISANDIKNELKDFRRESEKNREKFQDLQSNVHSQITHIENRVQEQLSSLTTECNNLREHSDKILSSTQESVAILNALILENKDGAGAISAFNAFAMMHEALLFGLDYESNNVNYIFSKLRQYGGNIQSLTFGSSFSIMKDGLYFCTPPFSGKSLRYILDTEFLPPIKTIETKIRSHKLFSSISHDYNVLMNQFYERIDICAKRNYPKDSSELHEQFK